LDALFDLMAEHHLAYQDIDKVVVDLNLYDSYLMKFPNPETGEEAKFSYPHILGTAILKGKVWLDSFTDESVTDHKYEGARRKVEVIVHPEWPAGRVDARTPVTLRLKDGRIFSKEIHTPREPTLDELLDRYREAAIGILRQDQTEKSLEMILNMEKVKDVSIVMNLLTPKI
jgi:2-methylcitrate dehydratase PrpD